MFVAKRGGLLICMVWGIWGGLKFVFYLQGDEGFFNLEGVDLFPSHVLKYFRVYSENDVPFFLITYLYTKPYFLPGIHATMHHSSTLHQFNT